MSTAKSRRIEGNIQNCILTLSEGVEGVGEVEVVPWFKKELQDLAKWKLYFEWIKEWQ